MSEHIFWQLFPCTTPTYRVFLCRYELYETKLNDISEGNKSKINQYSKDCISLSILYYSYHTGLIIHILLYIFCRYLYRSFIPWISSIIYKIFCDCNLSMAIVSCLLYSVIYLFTKQITFSTLTLSQRNIKW